MINNYETWQADSGELCSDHSASAAHCVLSTGALGVQQYRMTLWNQLLSLHTWKGDLMVCFCREGDFTAAALMTSCVSFTTTHIFFFFVPFPPQDLDHGHGLRKHRGIQHWFQSVAPGASEQVLSRRASTKCLSPQGQRAGKQAW